MTILKPISLAFLALSSLSTTLTTPTKPPTEAPETSLLAPKNLTKRAICTPTGPGVCTFGLANVQFPSPYLDEPPYPPDQYLFISDHNCDRIGFTDKPAAFPFAFESQLPYVVIVEKAQSVPRFGPRIRFRYAGQRVDSKKGGCACENDCFSVLLIDCLTCRCAFDC